MLTEIGLISIEHAVEPWEELLSAMVSVEDDWNAICGSNGTDVVSSSNSALDGGELAVIGDALGCISFYALFKMYGNRGTFPAKYAAPPWEVWRIIGDLLSRAASNAATTVEEDVTFYIVYKHFSTTVADFTYDSRNSELVLPGVLEELYLKTRVIISHVSVQDSMQVLTFKTSSPTMTPFFLDRTSVAPIIAISKARR